MRHTAVTVFLALGVLGVFSPLVSAADGTAKGEATDEKGQQGVGLGSGSGSSNVIMGGPDIIEGKITGIKGDQYSVQGIRPLGELLSPATSGTMEWQGASYNKLHPSVVVSVGQRSVRSYAP